MRGYLRTWHEFDLSGIEKSLIVAGDLSSECYSCHNIGIELNAHKCPHCGIEFRYIGLRRKVTSAFLKKLRDESPHLTIIDFDDFKKGIGHSAARKLLDL
ncbi:MAG: hypothetical protein PHP69_03915 [Candidatus Omnitrophica bacterium]|nr:hypothetical protein [Candidatus Omnitrophota bacterium]MDD5441157.1 hypothetical protein [Candidatus Omnitrophota bacterium]